MFVPVFNHPSLTVPDKQQILKIHIQGIPLDRKEQRKVLGLTPLSHQTDLAKSTLEKR